MLVKKCTKPGYMIEYFRKLLETFPSHNFRAKWQNQQLKHIVTNLPLNHAISVHDYSENYRCKDQTELQSSYFQKIEASLHVTLLFYIDIHFWRLMELRALQMNPILSLKTSL